MVTPYSIQAVEERIWSDVRPDLRIKSIKNRTIEEQADKHFPSSRNYVNIKRGNTIDEKSSEEHTNTHKKLNKNERARSPSHPTAKETNNEKGRGRRRRRRGFWNVLLSRAAGLPHRA